MTKMEKLEKAGQLRLPGIEILMDLVFEVGALVAAVVKATTIKISVTAKSISARLAGVLLVLSGDERELYDGETVEASIAGLDEDGAYGQLIGMGFEERGRFAHSR